MVDVFVEVPHIDVPTIDEDHPDYTPPVIAHPAVNAHSVVLVPGSVAPQANSPSSNPIPYDIALAGIFVFVAFCIWRLGRV